MSGWSGHHALLTCEHGVFMLQVCDACADERERTRIREYRIIDDRIGDMTQRRPWYARCHFCAYLLDHHETKCPWRAAMKIEQSRSCSRCGHGELCHNDEGGCAIFGCRCDAYREKPL